jgi:outer membrane protein TolC
MQRLSSPAVTPPTRGACGYGLLLALLWPALGTTQVPTLSLADTTTALVTEALAANQGLKAEQAGVARQLAELDRARARYAPSLDFSARYTRADGGRTIEFPLGDLLNPVYAALDAQLVAQGHPAQFPRIANQQFTFIRQREQETTLTLTQPLYDARLGAGRDAAQAELRASTASSEAYAVRLARDLKQAYYAWLRARAGQVVLQETEALATENLRINDSLFRAGKVTEDRVFRARADLLEVEQQVLEMRNADGQLAVYVNALRAKPGNTPLPEALVVSEDLALVDDAALSPAALQPIALAARAELKQLDAAIDGARASGRAARAAFQPQVGLQLTTGIQGTRYGFSADERFALASVVVKFNLFSGGADRAGLAVAAARLDEARARREDATFQVNREVQQAVEDFLVQRASLRTAEQRVIAAQGAFRIVSRKRDLGAANQAEFIDARRTLTAARLNIDGTRLGALSALAQLDYALGRTPSGIDTGTTP